MTQTLPNSAGICTVHLTIRIGGILHAIPIEAVEEVLPALPVEPISQLPSFVRGVVFVRGHLIPILDGTQRLELPARDTSREPQLVCLRLNGRLIGLEVDEAIDLVELPDHGRLPVPQLGGGRQFLSSIMDYQGEIVRLLDPTRLLMLEEVSEFASLS